MGTCYSTKNIKNSNSPHSPLCFFKMKSPPTLFLREELGFSGMIAKTRFGGIFQESAKNLKGSFGYEFFIYSEEVERDPVTIQISHEDSIFFSISSLSDPTFLQYHGPWLLKDQESPLKERIVVLKFEAGLMSLEEFLVMHGQLNEECAGKVAFSLAHSLAMLEGKGISHRNIKLQNITVTWQNSKLSFKILNLFINK